MGFWGFMVLPTPLGAHIRAHRPVQHSAVVQGLAAQAEVRPLGPYPLPQAKVLPHVAATPAIGGEQDAALTERERESTEPHSQREGCHGTRAQE